MLPGLSSGGPHEPDSAPGPAPRPQSSLRCSPGCRRAARMSAPGVLPSSGHAAPGADVVVPSPDLGGWRPRLVATDLDGTLLDSTGAVSPRTRAALEACWDAGIPVVGATG